MLKRDFRFPTFRYREWYQGCGGNLQHHSCRLDNAEALRGLEATEAWVAEPKRDGIWVAAFFDGEGNEFYSRTQELKPYSLDHELVSALEGSLLVGELGFGSQESKRRRAELGFDFMDVFDVLYHRYTYVGDLNGEDRRELLEEMWRAHNIPKNYLLCPRWETGFVTQYASQPEGLILKPKRGFPYVGGGAKVKHWLKAKKDHTVDMVIMGYEESTAETKVGKGMIEHLVCGMYVDGELKQLTKTGGMTHQMQVDIAADWKHYLGKVVELKHFGQFRSGALRHPSVVRVRDDKRPEDCVFDPDSVSLDHFKSL